MRRPPEDWPDGMPPARVHMDKSELWTLLEKWDSCGALYLTPTTDLAWDEACGVFRVPKDEHHDRLILNPTV
eukprot:7867112-Pyramimonas_sp.AAC.1